ncbi:polyprotein, partial [Ngoye virus]
YVSAISTADPTDTSILDWLAENGATWTKAGSVKIVQAAPGSGKTRILLPRMIAELRAKRKRTLVLAPTRVVLDEMCQALKGVSKSVTTRGELKESGDGLITLMCHATFSHLMLTPMARKNFEVVIMDEAHFLDPGSIAARAYWEGMAKMGMAAFVMMSATPPGEHLQAFPPAVGTINDRTEHIPTDWNTGHEWITDYEGRTAWFVPSAAAGARLAQVLIRHGKRVLCLSRTNFEKVYPQVRRGEFDFVLTTDIAEMGANLSVTRVIDPRLTRKPLARGDGIVMSGSIHVPTASAVQRRGRVGRAPHAVGEYVYQNQPDDDIREWACWTEAQMLLDNFQTTRSVAVGFCAAEAKYQPEAVGYFRLRNDRREEFVRFLDVRGMTTWAAWKFADAGMKARDRRWALEGPSTNILWGSDGQPVMIRADGVMKEVRMLVSDERFKEPEKVQELLHALRRSAGDILDALGRVPGHLAQRIPKAADTLGLLLNAEPGTRAFKEASREGPEAIELLTLVSIAVLLTGGLALVAAFRITGNRMSVAALSVAVTAVLMYWGGFSWGAMAGMVMTSTVFFLVVVPEPGGQRGVLDNQLAYVIIGIAGVVGMVYCNEMGLLEKTKRDLFGPRIVAGHLPMSSGWRFPDLRLDPAVTWGIYAGVVSVVTPWLLHMAEQAGAVAAAGVASAGATSLAVLSTGIPFLGVSYETWAVFASTGWHMSFSTAFAASICCLIHWSIVIPGAQANICRRAFRMVYAILAKNFSNDGIPTLEVPDAPRLEPTFEKRFAGWIMVALCVVSVVLDSSTSNVLLVSMLGTVGMQQALGIETWGLWGVGQACGMAVVLWRADPVGLVPLLCRLVLFQRDGRRGAGHMGPTLGEVWKKRLNAMSKHRFYEYKTSGIVEVNRTEAREAIRKGLTDHGHPVSRGAAKLHWLVERGFLEPKGWVTDLGCGRGGWSQYTATLPQVTRVVGYTLGTGGHEKPIPTESYGHNIITYHDKVDVMRLPPHLCDTVMCDIGESSSNVEVEAGRTVAVIEMFANWLEANPGAQFCCKVLCPYHPDVLATLEILVREHGGGLVRVPLPRNSTHEMYWVSGVKNKPTRAVNELSSFLLGRMARTHEKEIIEEIWLGTGVRHTVSEAEPDDLELIRGRLERIRRTHEKTWRVDTHHPYRYWNYHGSYEGAQRGSAGSLVNGVVKMLSWPWSTIESVTCMNMTDTTPFGQQRVFREKVDTKVPEPSPGTRKAMAVVAEWMWERFFHRKVARLCTREEFVAKVHSNAAIGAWDPQMGGWSSAAEAVQDEAFWQMVDEERDRHRRGECEMCVYNMMGKREKKPAKFGKARGSRAIWYMWLGSRFLEFEALGFLNEDHWMDRENSRAGVEGLGVQYLGYVLRDMERLPGVGYVAD